MLEDRYNPTEKLSPFLWRKSLREDPAKAYYLHWCPACKHGHTYPVGGIRDGGPNWSYNDNSEQPSFSPSMLIFMPAGRGFGQRTICHYYLTNGQIQYQGDCPHALAGQTVPMEPIPEDYGF